MEKEEEERNKRRKEERRSKEFDVDHKLFQWRGEERKFQWLNFRSS